MKTFSIISPIHAYSQEKADELYRCIESIKNQSYPKEFIEHIIINDGSTVPLTIPDYSWIVVVEQPNLQRITAYNNGFKKATKEVFCLLDADDEFVPNALEKINTYYEKYPNYPLFNFGCFYHHRDGGITERGPFKPKNKKTGHEIFGGGNIVNGTFVFRRDVYDSLKAFPENEIHNVDCTDLNYGGIRDLCVSSPYDFSAWFQVTFPETRQYFMVDVDSEPHKVIKEIGNPFGQDYALFYKFTRVFHSKPIDENLLIVHPR